MSANMRAGSERDIDGARILIAVHGYPPTFTGGAERRAQRTAQALHRRGCDVRVLCIESIGGDKAVAGWHDTEEDGIHVRRVNMSVPDGDVAFRWSYENPIAAAAFRDLVHVWRPDIVHQFS